MIFYSAHLCHGTTRFEIDFGFKAIEHRVSIHDLDATLLHELIDHTLLTCRKAGRDFRLSDVFGEVVKDILVSSVRTL